MKMSLSRIQSLRLSAVLEDCSDKLDVLGHTLTLEIIRKRDTKAAQERARLAKLRRNCQYISQEVHKLRLELEDKQSFSCLLQVVEEEEQRKNAENMRSEFKRELEQRHQTLQRQKEELIQKSVELKVLSRLSQDLKQRLIVQLAENAMKKKLEEERNESHLLQAQWGTSRTEKLLEDQRESLQKQLKEEMRVHEESVKFLQIRHEELQQQLQQWQQNTKQMLHEQEQQLNIVCCKRTLNVDRLMEMRRKFREMQQLVMEDREEEEKLRQQQAKVKAAIKLQAWWRGCMVRRGLGIYKKADKGKKDKKGKKKEGNDKKKK